MEHLKPRIYAPGDLIMQSGESGDEMFFLNKVCDACIIVSCQYCSLTILSMTREFHAHPQKKKLMNLDHCYDMPASISSARPLCMQNKQHTCLLLTFFLLLFCHVHAYIARVLLLSKISCLSYFSWNKGSVDVLSEKGQLLATLGEGSILGEVAFFQQNSRRTATVRANAW